MKFKYFGLILAILFLCSVALVNVSEDVTAAQNSGSIPILGHLQIKDSVSGEMKNVSYEASGYCYKVVDGDTFWVDGVGKVRFVGVNTPERGETGYQEAKDFVKEKCLGKTVYLDIDNSKYTDKYGRTLAIVYVDDMNLNQELLVKDYAEIMFIPPSEFEKGLGTL